MILNPKFYAPGTGDRHGERMRLGLEPDRPTGLVLFGGEGSREMLRIAEALNRADSGVQLILLCGKNDSVAGELRAMKKRIPMLVVGFTREVPFFMDLADFFIGKPGPGSISEALAKRLPVIVERTRGPWRMSAITRNGSRNRASEWWSATSRLRLAMPSGGCWRPKTMDDSGSEPAQFAPPRSMRSPTCWRAS